MEKRLTPRFLVALSLLGLWGAVFFWSRAFPTAALHFEVTEGKAVETAKTFLVAEGQDPRGYRTATQFGEDTETKYYLELVRGVHAMEQLTSAGLNIWYWNVRWFRPEQEEEFAVAVDPHGALVGYSHTIPESQAAPLVTEPQARKIAEAFLGKYVPHLPVAGLKFVEESSLKRPNRTDYYFTWQRDDLRVGDAPYEIYVTVQGDQVGEFNESLKVPEAWSRHFNTQRETNELFQTIAEFALLPIGIGMFVFFIIGISRHRIHWKNAVPARWLLLMTAVTAANTWNDYPSAWAQYSTTQQWGSFVVGQISAGALGLLTSILGFYVLSLIADAFYRDQLPEKLPFVRALGRHALSEPETVRALGIGIAFACFGLGYVCVFYTVAQHFGAWAPIDIDYSKLLSGPIPWISGLQIGMQAAWTEEFGFRVIGILLYLKLTRLRGLSTVLACATWAFLHSNYPQMPGYLRGIELTMEGVLWGVLMQKFGIISTLTAHYLYDCWLGSLIVVQSPDWGHRIGAIAVSSWPVILWAIGVMRLRAGKRAPDAVKQTGADPALSDTSGTALVPEFSFALPVFSPRQRIGLWMVTVALLVWVVWMPKPEGDIERLGVADLSRNAIATKADTLLQQHGYVPGTYRRVISLGQFDTETTYLIGVMPREQIARLFETEWPDLRWNVRYFRFGEKEEFGLILDKSGGLVQWRHLVPRESPGASLEKAQARQVAETFLRWHGVALDQEELIEDSMNQEEHRRDYDFVWKRKNWKWGEAQLRTALTIQGDEPVRFGRYVKIPEAWERDREKSGWKKEILHQIHSWTGVAFSVLGLVLFVLLVRDRRIPWKTVALLALLPTGLGAVAWLNQLPWFYASYTTTTPWGYYVAEQWGTEGVGLVMVWILSILQMGFTVGLCSWALGWDLSRLRLAAGQAGRWGRRFPDLLMLLAFSLTVFALNGSFHRWINGVAFPEQTVSFEYTDVNAAFPWVQDTVQALQAGISGVLSLAVKAGLAMFFYQRRSLRWMTWVFLFGDPLYDALAATHLREYVIAAGLGELNLLLMLFFVCRVWRFDVTLIFLVYAVDSLVSAIGLDVMKGGAAYAGQAVPLLLATLLLVMTGAWFRSRLENQEATAASA